MASWRFFRRDGADGDAVEREFIPAWTHCEKIGATATAYFRRKQLSPADGRFAQAGVGIKRARLMAKTARHIVSFSCSRY